MDVFTTNYDQIIEQYMEIDEKITVHERFQFHNIDKKIYWDKDSYMRDAPSGDGINVRLHKLHGSLNWRRILSNDTEKCSSEDYISDSGEYR